MRHWVSVWAFLYFVATGTAGETQSLTEVSLPNFDDVVEVSEPAIVYRDFRDSSKFYLVPISVIVPDRWQLSMIYRNSGGEFSGNAVIDASSLISEEMIDSVKAQLSKLSPNPTVIVAQPAYSEFQVKLFGTKDTVTDRFVVNPIGSNVTISFEVGDLAVRSLLHETSYLADVGVVTFKFALKGVEIGQSFEPRVTRRWFAIHSVIEGNCVINPDRFLNVATNKTGCAYRIQVRRGDVISVQKFLKAEGYYSALVDGVFGPFTRDSIKRFQEDAGLYPDGLISQRLIDVIAREVQIENAD